MFAVIFGTRPEYLKLKSMIDEFQKQDILQYKVIYIQQHSTIDEPLHSSYETISIVNDSSVNRLSSLGSQILTKLPDYIEDCSYVIVQGDTATAFYSAITAFQMHKKIIHIEAGLRTYDLEKPFPEEGYRQMISRIATIHFTPHEDSNKVLENERVLGKIYNVGNTILDVIQSYKLECQKKDLVLITFHRRENWEKIDILLSGLKKLVEKTPHIQYIWYLHPNPDLQEKVKEAIQNIPTIELRGSCCHKEFTQQMAAAQILITDSGGIQEEASFLGKHCIVLRASTERNHIPKKYITILEDYSRLDEVYETIPTNDYKESCNVYGNGDSAKKIINILHSLE